jgi:hypothetical protein
MTNQAGLQQNMFGNMAFQGQMMDPTQRATMQQQLGIDPQQQSMFIQGIPGAQQAGVSLLSSPVLAARDKQLGHVRGVNAAESSNHVSTTAGAGGCDVYDEDD